MDRELSKPLIIYLHGFCSSPASWKSQMLAEEMARRGMAAQFVCPQLSWVPNEAVASVSRLIEQAGGPVTLIGSSLGGHYANHLAEKSWKPTPGPGTTKIIRHLACTANPARSKPWKKWKRCCWAK